MSRVVFEIKRSYSEDGQVKIGVIPFGPRSVGDRGLDILAAKVALGQLVSIENPERTTSNFERHIWTEPGPAGQMGIQDGDLFDKKLESVLIEYQLSNSESMQSYFLGNLPADTQDASTRAKELFNAELGILGPATLRCLHGWSSPSAEFFDRSYGDGTETRRSPLSDAVQNVLRVSNTMTGLDADSIDQIKRKERTIRAFQPNHLADPGPFTVDINTLGFYCKTDFTYANPPVFQNADEEREAIAEILNKAVFSFVKYKNLPDIWILKNSLRMDAVYTAPPGPNHDGSVTSAGFYAVSTKVGAPDSQNFSVLDSPSDSAPLVEFKEFRSPSQRPGDVYRALVYINKHKANLIKDGIRTYRSNRQNAFIPLPATVQDSIDKQKETAEAFKKSKASSTLGLSEEETEIKLQEFRSFAAKRKIDIARQLRAAALSEEGKEVEIDLGPLGTHNVQKKSNYMTAAEAVSIASAVGTAIGEFEGAFDPLHESVDNYSLTIDRLELQSKIIAASENLRKFAPDLKGEDIRPAIDLNKEADSLDEVFLALNELVKVDSRYSSFITNTTASDDDSYRPGINDIQTASTVYFTFKFRQVQKVPGRIEGLRIDTITIESGDSLKTVVYSSTDAVVAGFLQDNAPLNNPRTMGYFWQIDKISEDSGFSLLDLIACEDIFGKPMKPGVQYALKYTFPTLKIESRVSVPSQIKEFTREIESTVDEWWESTKDNLESGVPETFSIAPTLPDFSKVCGLDKIYKELLDITDIKSILCDYLRCIKLPNFNFNLNLNFQLPEIPILPTFDFMVIFVKMLIQAFVDMLVAMLCALINTLLQSLAAPDCDANFNNDLFGSVDLDDELAQQALGDFFTDTGISQDLLDDARELLGELFGILDPREICSLLNGEASDQTLAVISNYVESTNPGPLEDFFSDKQNIIYFFTSIGAYIDPSFCEEIERLSNLDARSNRSDSYLEDCTPSELVLGQVRRRLQEGKASPEEIQKALDMKQEEMEKYSEALAKALNGEEIANILPSVVSAADPDSLVSDTPTHLKNMTNHVIDGVLSLSRSTYIQEINAFVQNLSESLKVLPEPGDDSYDADATIEFETAVERLRYASLIDPGEGMMSPNLNPGDLEATMPDVLSMEFLMVDEDGNFVIPPEEEEATDFVFETWKLRVVRPGNASSPRPAGQLVDLATLKPPVALYKLTEQDLNVLNNDPTGDDDNLGYQLSAGFLSVKDYKKDNFPVWTRESGRPLVNGRTRKHYDASLENLHRITGGGTSAMLKHVSETVEKMMPRALSMQSRDTFFPMRFISPVSFSRSANLDYTIPPSKREARLNLDTDREVAVVYNDTSTYSANPSETRMSFVEIEVADGANNIGKTFTYCRPIPDDLRDLLGDQVPSIPYIDQDRPKLKMGMFHEYYIKNIRRMLSSPSVAHPDVDNATALVRGLIQGEDSEINSFTREEIYDSTFAFISQKIIKIIEDNKEDHLGVPKSLQNINYLKNLESRLIGRSSMDPIAECRIKPASNMHKDTILSFDNWTKNAANHMNAELMKDKKNPLSVDFSGPFSADRGVSLIAIETYLKVLCVEVLLKGLPYNAILNSSTYSETQFFLDYMVEFVHGHLTNSRIFSDAGKQNQFIGLFLKLANYNNQNTDDTSLKMAIKSILPTYISEIFQKNSEVYQNKDSQLIDYLMEEILEDSKRDRSEAKEFVLGPPTDVLGGFMYLGWRKASFNSGYGSGLPTSRFIIEHYVRIINGDSGTNQVRTIAEAENILEQIVEETGSLDNVSVSFGIRLSHTHPGLRGELNEIKGGLLSTVEGQDRARIDRAERSGICLTEENDESLETVGVLHFPMASYEKNISCASSDSIQELFNNEVKKSLMSYLKETREVQQLFSFFFPIDDIAASTLAYSIGYTSTNEFSKDLFSPTKTMLLNTALISMSRDSFSRQSDSLAAAGLAGADEMRSKTNSEASSDGPLLGCLAFDLPGLPGGGGLPDLAEAFEKFLKMLFKQFPSVLLRGLANELDPAYNEMRKHHMNCRPTDAHLERLNLGALRIDSLKGLGHVSLAEGTDKRGDCENPGKYVSVATGFPVELVKGIGMALVSPGTAKYILEGSVYKLINYISSLPKFMIEGNYSILCTDGDFKFTDRDLNNGFLPLGRYGHPLTPLTLLALSTHELPGENVINNCEPYNICGENTALEDLPDSPSNCDEVTNPIGRANQDRAAANIGNGFLFGLQNDTSDDEVGQGNFIAPDSLGDIIEGSMDLDLLDLLNTIPDQNVDSNFLWELFSPKMKVIISQYISNAYGTLLRTERDMIDAATVGWVGSNGAIDSGARAMALATFLRTNHPYAFRRHFFIQPPLYSPNLQNAFIDEPATPGDVIMWYGYGVNSGLSGSRLGIIDLIVGYLEEEIALREQGLAGLNATIDRAELPRGALEFMRRVLRTPLNDGHTGRIGPQLPTTARDQRTLFEPAMGAGPLMGITNIHTYWTWNDIVSNNTYAPSTPSDPINSDRNTIVPGDGNHRQIIRDWMGQFRFEMPNESSGLNIINHGSHVDRLQGVGIPTHAWYSPDLALENSGRTEPWIFYQGMNQRGSTDHGWF